jgi:hypothetical protein
MRDAASVPMSDALGEWRPFDVATVHDLFRDVPAPWWLSGGVALDRFLGRTTRAHGDIDVSICRRDWPVVAAALGDRLELYVAKDARLHRVDGELRADERNIWACERAGGPWRVQVNLEAGDDERWVYRRDPRVSRLWRDARFDDDGVPCVNPAVQLLWKARDVTAKDQADFDAVVPHLTASDRQWLTWAVGFAHPTSPWLTRLGPRRTRFL